MRDEDKTKAQLLDEVLSLRERNRELEASEMQLRLAEEAFWESEQRFRIIVDNAYDGICICEHPDQGNSPIKRLIYCNDRFVRQSGHDRPYIRKLETIDQVLTHHLSDEEHQQNIRSLKQHEPYRGISSWNRPDGRENFHEWVSVPITIEDGLFSVSILRDITERRQTEQDRVRMERLSALGEMTAGISHHLNNILMGVLGPAQLLLQKVTDPNVKDHLDLIVTSADRAAGLVQRMYHAVRGNEEEPCHPVDAATVIREAIESGRPRWKDQAEARGVTIEIITNLDEIPPIHGTKTQFHNLLLNLLFNACDAMDKSGQITIAAKCTGDNVHFKFSDSGIGMPKAVAKRIFEPFFTTKTDIGTGLGLATVYATVKSWGGDVTVASQPNVGTQFDLILPVWKGENTLIEPHETPEGTESARILVVDDDEIVLEFLNSFLGEIHTVSVAKNSDEALALFGPDTFDIALLDLGMPGLSGDQLAKQMRNTDPKLVTVLITGWELAEHDHRFKPFDLRYQKPLRDLKGFQSTITKAIQISKMRHET